MSKISQEMKSIYELTFLLASKHHFPVKYSLVGSLATKIIDSKNLPALLGDAYLDYLNYEKEIEKGNLELFLDFFEISVKPISKEEGLTALRRALESPQKDKVKTSMITYKLVKENNLIKEYENYIKLREIF